MLRSYEVSYLNLTTQVLLSSCRLEALATKESTSPLAPLDGGLLLGLGLEANLVVGLGLHLDLGERRVALSIGLVGEDSRGLLLS